MLFHKCQIGCSLHAAAGDRVSTGSGRRSHSTFTIDMHCHVVTPEIEGLVAARAEKSAEMSQLARGLGVESTDYNNRVMLPSAGPKLTNLDLRFADMDAMKIDVQVISPSPTQYY